MAFQHVDKYFFSVFSFQVEHPRDDDASTPTSTGSGSITSGPDSDPASTPESEGPDPENKATAIAEELENVSNKAIQSAKTFGSKCRVNILCVSLL